jgi:4-hydroxy-3-methylbut-2-enyl diphosphate reductase
VKVLVAETAGFCWGVKRAVDQVLALARSHKGPVCTLGPLIHNRKLLAQLESLGVSPVEFGDIAVERKNPDNGPDSGLNKAAGTTLSNQSDSPARGRKLVVIRAHGVAPRILEQVQNAPVDVHDATCPLVRHAQQAVQRSVAEGNDIVIVGDRGHAEVEGLVGYADGKAQVIAGVREVSAVSPSDRPTCAIAQTTQDEEAFDETMRELRKIRPNCREIDTICGSTKKRQGETRELARRVDVMVVVGDRQSANTARLKAVAENAGTRALLVEDPDELTPEAFEGLDVVGVTAGASTPSWLIGSVVDKLHLIARQRKGSVVRALLKFLSFLVHANIVAAVGAASLVVAISMFERIRFPAVAASITALYVFSMHTLNRFVDRSLIPPSEETGLLIYCRFPTPILVASAIAGLGTLAVALYLGWLPFVLVALSLAGGAVYGVRILPPSLSGLIGIWRIKDIPASKDLSTAAGWAMLTAVVPFAVAQSEVSLRNFLAFAFAFVLVLIRSTMLGVRSVQRDLIVGRETVFNVLGRKGTNIALALMFLALASSLAGLAALGGESLALRLSVVLPYIVLYVFLHHGRVLPHGAAGEFLIEAQFAVCGLAVLLP